MMPMKNIVIFLLTGLITVSQAAANDLAEAIAFYQERDYISAADKLEKLATGNPDALFPLAVSQFRTSDYKAAEETLEELMKRHSDNPDAHYLSGMVKMGLLNEVSVFRKLGVAKSALGAWEKSVETDPTYLQGNYAVFSYLANAPGMAGGDMDRAVSMIPALMELNPVYGEMAKGMLASKNEQTVVALAHYEKAGQLAGDEATPWFSIAQFYIQNNQFEKALAALEEFESRNKVWYDPVDANILLSKGRALAGLGQKDAAKTALNAALKLATNDRTKDFVEEQLDKL